ncbi:MAG: flotillin domain-containing protein, partial [Pseudomonadota bacterium]
TDEARHSLFKRKMLEHIEGIIGASVKPLENINDIKIMQLGGAGANGLSVGGDGAPANGAGGPNGASPTDEVINSALRYRVQAPMVDSLLSDIGIDGSNIAKSGGLIREASDLNRIEYEQRRNLDAKAKAANKPDTGDASTPPPTKPAASKASATRKRGGDGNKGAN